MSKELEKSIKHVFDRAKEMGDMYESETPHIAKKLNEDIEVVKELLKRNEPMKVDSPNYYGFGYYMCPKCRDIVLEEHDNYCCECGQKLDWSGEK